MKNLWKIAAALAVIAGALVVILRFGGKLLEKLKELRCCCPCDESENCCCVQAEEAAGATEAAGEPEKSEQAPAAESDVTQEDFAD